MAKKGFLTDTEKDILSGDYEGSEEGEYAARYRLKNHAEESLRELVQVAESDQVQLDDEVWYRYIPRLIHGVMAPPDDFIPLQRFDGTELEHRKEYPLQYALLDRLVESVDAYDDAFHPKKMVGGLRDDTSALDDLDEDE